MDEALLARFTAITGAQNALTPQTHDLTHYTHENRKLVVGKTPLVLRPASTAEVAAIVRLASETGTALVPQGGHTGHAGGGVPDESGTQIVVSLERMNFIRDVDPDGNTITAEAGVVLQTLQEAAQHVGRLFPLAISSQGSCQIGGNISTNAGGTGVIAHGNMREQVLGLEVVLPSGEIWNGLRRLKKDNTGYALKQLFIGAEGTLGIITAAVLRLAPLPKGREVAWAAVPSPHAALQLLNLSLDMAGPGVTAFELIHRTPLEFVLRNAPGSRDPLAQRHEWQVLMEISSGRSEQDARDLAEGIFAAGMERGLVADAVIAETIAQRGALWKLRDDMGPAQWPEGISVKHDVSVPVHLLPQFLERGAQAVAQAAPEARLCAFGHMGDGNIHFNVSQPLGVNGAAYLKQRQGEIQDRVHALVLELGGSISAEHGIGRLKRDLLIATKSAVELETMRAIKRALDPKNIMNPGKVV
jgi:FAD/FMN-containing dehydrogenase